MARAARVKNEYGIYYISQLGATDRNLFTNDEDRDKFLSILALSKEVNGFKLYAYCLINSNEYHLIIGSNGSDISKIMKGVNISYAMYVNHPDSIFKDRYKSILIKDKSHLLKTLDSIHKRAKEKDNIYNSYCYFDNIISIEGILDEVDLMSLDEEDDCLVHRTEGRECIKSMEEAIDKLNEIAHCKHLSVDELIINKPSRNSLIKQFRRESTLSLKELGQLFGNLSESTISKILKQ
ncbi:MAG: hypothetical protein M0Q14_01425 [Tissierellaceae bacterium]|nr:hypothetical protein [Tissierellaceae bacterium]